MKCYISLGKGGTCQPQHNISSVMTLSYLRLIQTYMYFTADTLSSLFDCFVRLCSFDAWRGYLSICKRTNVG